MSSPRLLHVFPSFVPAGAQLRAIQLLESFASRYQHTIVAMDGNTAAAGLIPESVDFEIRSAPTGAGPVADLIGISRILSRVDPHLTLTYNWGAIDAVVAARMQRRSVVHHEDGFNADEALRLKMRRNLTRSLILPGIHRLIVPSHRLLTIARQVWKIPDDRLQLIPNGIEIPAVVPSGTREALQGVFEIPALAPIVGFVGHLRPVKKVSRLIEMIGRFSGQIAPHLVLVGDGPERTNLEAAARTLGLQERVHFAGHRVDVVSFLMAMDVFALGSESEQMPISILEAMAAGLPIVATDVGDVRRMLPADQGPYIVPTGDRDIAGDLATALRTLLGSPELRSQLGRQNLAHVSEHYSRESMVDAYLGVYQSGIGSGPIQDSQGEARR